MSKTAPYRTLVICIIGLLLSGCGIRVPPIDEGGDRVEATRFVQAVIFNIDCELQRAFTDLHQIAPLGTFLDSWGVQTTLTLTYDETTSLSPNVLGAPAPAIGIFTVNGGLGFSSEAIRTNTTNGYFLVSDLERSRCPPNASQNGPYLLQSNLGLSEWIRVCPRTSCGIA
jgi:hypothetical protein